MTPEQRALNKTEKNDTREAALQEDTARSTVLLPSQQPPKKPRRKRSPNKRPFPQRPINPKIDLALDLLAQATVRGGKAPTITEVAKIARIRRESLSIALKRGQVAARAREKVLELLGSRGVMRAGAKLVELIDAPSDYVGLEAAKHVLSVGGIKPAEENRAASFGGLNVTVVLKHQSANLTDQRAPRAQQIEAKAQRVEDER